MERINISQSLISQHDIQSNLITIFPDSVILDNNQRMVAVSDQVAKALGYTARDLTGKPLQDLTEKTSVIKRLKKELSKGFFDHFLTKLKGNGNKLISCKISGFYLGLISDINGVAILKIKPIDEVQLLSKHLEDSRQELDEFVYRTAHDLRGPLATIRGLVNLLKLENGSSASMKNIIELLDSQAQTMDDRLFNLNYLSVMSNEKTGDSTLDCAELESTLRSTLEENIGIDNLDFQFKTSQPSFSGVNTQLIISILNHLLLYLINLPQKSETKLRYTIEKANQGMHVIIYAEGFLSNYNIIQAVKRKDPLYTTIITYADLINFFAAMKNAERIRATMNVDFIFEKRQQLSVTIPMARKLY